MSVSIRRFGVRLFWIIKKHRLRLRLGLHETGYSKHPYIAINTLEIDDIRIREASGEILPVQASKYFRQLSEKNGDQRLVKLFDDIALNGLRVPILVVPTKVDGTWIYLVHDGYHRLAISAKIGEGKIGVKARIAPF